MKFQKLVGRTTHSMQDEIEHGFSSVPRNCFIQLERYAKEYVLRNIKEGKTDVSKLRRMLGAYKTDSGLELSVSNFLKCYDLESQELYKYSTLYELEGGTGQVAECEACDSPLSTIPALSKVFARLCKLDDIGILRFLIGYLKSPIEDLTSSDSRKLLMFYYSLFNAKPPAPLHIEFKKMIMATPGIIKEMVELLTYNLNRVSHVPVQLNIEPGISLELHAEYTSNQILALLGASSVDHFEKLAGVGVKYFKDLHLDVFFITLNKSEKHFKETTLYEDYAISDSLFHWQSQSRTTVQSPTGQRYINQGVNGSRVLLFVRKNKNDQYGATEAFKCLGLADYIKHSGSAPISIEYRLRDKMPLSLLRESNRYVDLG